MTHKEDQQPMTTREELVGPWGFESDETSSGPMFSVYDNRGRRLTEPYIEEEVARLIAAAPELLAVMKSALRILERDFPNGQLVIDARAAIAAATGGNHEQD